VFASFFIEKSCSTNRDQCRCSFWLNVGKFAPKIRLCARASDCPDFAARLFAQTPFASCLPQDPSRELMFEPCAKHNPGASASLHWNLAALRERRTDHAHCATSHNCLVRQLNPSRPDRRSMSIALKPLDLLDFLTVTKRQNPAKQRLSPRFGRNAPEVCRKRRRFRPVQRALKCDAT
jgi:hypothetical protein